MKTLFIGGVWHGRFHDTLGRGWYTVPKIRDVALDDAMPAGIECDVYTSRKFTWATGLTMRAMVQNEMNLDDAGDMLDSGMVELQFAELPPGTEWMISRMERNQKEAWLERREAEAS